MKIVANKGMSTISLVYRISTSYLSRLLVLHYFRPAVTFESTGAPINSFDPEKSHSASQFFFSFFLFPVYIFSALAPLVPFSHLSIYLFYYENVSCKVRGRRRFYPRFLWHINYSRLGTPRVVSLCLGLFGLKPKLSCYDPEADRRLVFWDRAMRWDSLLVLLLK